MKPNKPVETYANRVAQFERDEQLQTDAAILRSKGKIPKHPDLVAKENPYLQARLKVLSNYKEETSKQILRMEELGKIDNRIYNQFLCDILIAAGDIPTHDLRRSTEFCNCFLCQYLNEKKK